MAPRPEDSPPPPWHALTGRQVVDRTGSLPQGLSAAEASRRLTRDGPNRVEPRPHDSWPIHLLRQFASPLVLVLAVAAGLAFAMHKPFDVWVIVGAIAVNAATGFLQESRAAAALAALRRLTVPLARILREGEPVELPAAEVVVGDVLLLAAGDQVAADARVVQSFDLAVDQAALTGESAPVAKDAAAHPVQTPLADRANMVYQGSAVTAGRGLAVAVATGFDTEAGRIAYEVVAPAVVTPLQRRLGRVTLLVGIASALAVALVLAIGLLRRLPFLELLQASLDLGVAIVPEGLPIVVSVLLAVGVHRMARRNALVRRLPAVEALGSATVICTDKTGTLTRNAMAVTCLVAGGEALEVEEAGYSPHGHLLSGGRPLSVEALWALRWLGRCAHQCNDAVLERTEVGWGVRGDPTEGALQALAGKIGTTEDWERLQEIPFGHERRFMATLNRAPDGELVAFVKGAPDVLLPLCPGDPRAAQREAERLAARPLRVLALGMVRHLDHPGAFAADLLDGRLEFLGLTGLADPPRPGAAQAVASCRTAGIRVLMLTGDQPATAAAVARDLGIGGGAAPVSGPELDAMSDEGLAGTLRTARVFARVTPTHKLRIVTALRRLGEVVAVTGDGVNDVPALVRADIGISMGLSGTEVAKAAADIVLADDDFSTIVAAVAEGRTISGNFRQVLEYLLTTSAGSALTLTVAVAVGLPLPLRAVQFLWLNLVTDGLFDKALALEPASEAALRRPPDRPDAAPVSRRGASDLALSAVVMATGTLAAFAWDLGRGVELDRARTLAFTTLVAFQWFHAFASRLADRSLLELPPNRWMIAALGIAMSLQAAALYVPPLRNVLGTAPLGPGEAARALLLGSAVLALSEAVKAVRRSARRPRPAVRHS